MGLLNVKHIASKQNPSDVFTKEDKDTNHYINARNSIMCDYEDTQEPKIIATPDTLPATQKEAEKVREELNDGQGQKEHKSSSAQQTTQQTGGC